MNYIKRFQHSQALSVSVGNTYSKDQLMHTYMDNFHQDGKYSAQKASHKAYLRREGKLAHQNLYLFHTYRLIIKILKVAQVVVEIMREHIFSRHSALFVEVLIILQKNDS